MINLLALRAFSDNCFWMLHDGGQAVVVDPGADAAVDTALAEPEPTPAGILVTHCRDHPVGGSYATRGLPNGSLYCAVGESMPEPFKPFEPSVPVVRLDDGARLQRPALPPNHDAVSVYTALPEWKNQFR